MFLKYLIATLITLIVIGSVILVIVFLAGAALYGSAFLTITCIGGMAAFGYLISFLNKRNESESGVN